MKCICIIWLAIIAHKMQLIQLLEEKNLERLILTWIYFQRLIGVFYEKKLEINKKNGLCTNTIRKIVGLQRNEDSSIVKMKFYILSYQARGFIAKHKTKSIIFSFFSFYCKCSSVRILKTKCCESILLSYHKPRMQVQLVFIFVFIVLTSVF